MSPEIWEKPPELRQPLSQGGVRVVARGSNTTGFFTTCESQSRLTVSLMKHTEGIDVFA
jgi:hypothetical protein